MQKKRLSSGFSPQKREPMAQSSVGEPSGFARRHCFESMAVVFAIDGACLPVSVRLAYSTHAISLEFKLSKHILLLLTLIYEIPGQAGDDKKASRTSHDTEILDREVYTTKKVDHF